LFKRNQIGILKKHLSVRLLYFTLLLLFFPLAGFTQSWKEWNEQGMVFYKQGAYEEAKRLFSNALQSANPASTEYAISLTNVGHCQQAQGNYPAAQQTFRQSVRVIQKLHPPLHIERIDAALNLGNAFLPSGQYDSCEFYVLQAEQWVKENVNTQSAHYQNEIFKFFDASINIQNTMASLAYRKGQWTKAVALMEQQQQFLMKMYPEEYGTLSIYHSTLNNLTTYFIAAGEFQKARRVATEHLAMLTREQQNKLSYISALNNLGSIYRNLEQYDSAILIYTSAAHMLDTSAYHGSDLHIAVLNNLGDIFFSFEEYASAITALQNSISLQEKRGGLNPRIYQSTLLNLAETYHWMGDLQRAEQIYQKLTTALTEEILHHYTYLSDAEKISFFRSNVSVLENFSMFAFELSGDMKLRKDSVSYTSRSSLNELFNLLLATKGMILHPGLRLKNTILTGTNAELKSKYQLWEDKKYAYANEARRENADPKRISILSQEIETLEKWLRLHSATFQKGFVMEKKTWQDVQRSLAPDEAAVEVVRLAGGIIYGAMILTSSTTESPVVALVKSKAIQRLEKQFYKNYANSIQYDFTDSTSYNIFWKPILDEIKKHAQKGKTINRVYFSSDGVYNKINLNTLQDPLSGEYVINQVEIVQVTNMREVISHKQKLPPVEKTIVLFGRPQFYVPGKEKTLTLSDLPGTEKEVNQIDSIFRRQGWKTTLYTFEKANEAIVKKLRSPAIIHFGTHGFVVQDSLSDLADLMLNAGIALAGAGVEATSGEDGILTAYELMSVDLENTNLVVLSACETGLGEYYSGEGIYGLQRAIRSAGSKAILMSLWKVDDIATQKLMTLFYEIWLRQKKEPREAFRAAQLELMRRYPQPRYWGAFVFGGK